MLEYANSPCCWSVCHGGQCGHMGIDTDKQTFATFYELFHEGYARAHLYIPSIRLLSTPITCLLACLCLQSV